MVRKRRGDSGPSKTSQLLQRIRAWGDAEEGLSEVTGAIFVLPILGFTIFALIETGVYMRYRIQVEKVLQETAMNIGQDGGAFWNLTSPPGLSTNRTWVDVGNVKLQNLCDANGSSGNAGNRCKNGETPPKITCWIGAVGQSPTSLAKQGRNDTSVFTSPDGSMKQVAKTRGQTVYCTASFPYEPVSPLSKNPWTSLGLSTLFDKNITLGASSQTVVGFSNN